MMAADLTAARAGWIEEEKDVEAKAKRQASDFLSYESAENVFADFHANRHTFITNLGRSGVSPKLAQTLARHSDIRLTFDIYTHAIESDVKFYSTDTHVWQASTIPPICLQVWMDDTFDLDDPLF